MLPCPLAHLPQTSRLILQASQIVRTRSLRQARTSTFSGAWEGGWARAWKNSSFITGQDPAHVSTRDAQLLFEVKSLKSVHHVVRSRIHHACSRLAHPEVFGQNTIRQDVVVYVLHLGRHVISCNHAPSHISKRWIRHLVTITAPSLLRRAATHGQQRERRRERNDCERRHVRQHLAPTIFAFDERIECEGDLRVVGSNHHHVRLMRAGHRGRGGKQKGDSMGFRSRDTHSSSSFVFGRNLARFQV